MLCWENISLKEKYFRRLKVVFFLVVNELYLFIFSKFKGMLFELKEKKINVYNCFRILNEEIVDWLVIYNFERVVEIGFME